MKTVFSMLVFLVFLLETTPIQAQDSTLSRKYQIGLYNQFDLRNSSTNAISVHRMLHDGFRKGLKPKLNDKLGNLTYGLFSFSTTYLTMLWSHEFGHKLRAAQVGGQFKIHNVALPFPYTTMHLPGDIGLVDESLTVTGGFEVNYLQVRALQSDFVRQNGIYNADLSLAFANRLMYPLYASLLVRVDPKDPNTWINTAGDPVHIALPVFKNYSNDQVILADSTVNPELVQYFGRSALFASLFNLLDPQFYREVGATFGKDKRRRPNFLIGDYHNGWTYGTMFNTSPLGYELYLQNYLHIRNQHFAFYFKYGNPFKNNGFGISWYDIIQNDKLNLSAQLDVWDQDIFGKGIAAEVSTEYRIGDQFGLLLNAGYKTDGYVLGKQLGEGVNVGFNLTYYAKP